MCAFICLLYSTPIALADPAWWGTRGVLDTNTVADYAPVILGQLKWTAAKAQDELAANLSGGAGSAVGSLVSGFATTGNWQVANIGQIKAVAKPFYDRLIAEGYTNAYPWSATTNDDTDYALANIGQLKNLFSFSLTNDFDSDSLYDWWEMYWFGNTNSYGGTDDPDSDGLSNLGEYMAKCCPTNSDTDADGLLDGSETGTGVYVDATHTGSSPTDSDSDDDGLLDGNEVAGRTDPNNPDVIKPTVVIIAPCTESTREAFP